MDDSLGGFILFIILVVFIFFCSIPFHLVRGEGIYTVVKTERVPETGYMIYTENETFRNTDSWIEFKFNSSDIYGKIIPGKKYKFRYYGIRLQFLSWYRNIVSAEEIRK